MRVLRFQGKVIDLRRALMTVSPKAGTVLADERGRRRIQRRLRKAEIASITAGLRRGGGDAA